ncbi:type II toxin-antitoxin system PemK/MazF family toxin [Niveispirillum cyanobacteriorum]|uniref:type II toxin-antitoxin system PemK/MazF family toxin n=1 Tax=Niveispirillum cyanobacteriorum TaxID=1612173 RepID=UPI001B3B757E
MRWTGSNGQPNSIKRGDVIVVAVTGEDGTPRPAIIVQTDVFPGTHAPVIICQITSQRADDPDFRVTIEPSPENGLREPSQVMVDKPVTVRRDRLGQVIGRLTPPRWRR